ncbi:MAG: transglutaminase-like cysteine peptidase, partial [Desulfovibrionaceae bacterium]|nr:transglutaminase-like cysteine peptidase [Desulfovibrionaceae bacterium]
FLTLTLWGLLSLFLGFKTELWAYDIPGVSAYGSFEGKVSERRNLDEVKDPSPSKLQPSAKKEDKSVKSSKEETSPQGQKLQLFNTVEFKRPLNSLPGWLQLLERNKANPIFVSGKKFNKSTTWDSFKAQAKGKSGLALLRYVHNFWNQWPYKEDGSNWGRPDYWAIPAEFLQKSGDCEDYAIIKYFTLKELGIPADKMRIVVLRDTVRNLAHAVLVVYLNDDAYILDNLSNAVLSHTHFKHYTPQYSVNELGRWAHLKGRPKHAAAK